MLQLVMYRFYFASVGRVQVLCAAFGYLQVLLVAVGRVQVLLAAFGHLQVFIDVVGPVQVLHAAVRHLQVSLAVRHVQLLLAGVGRFAVHILKATKK